jgi:hypothetical protein
MPHTPGPWKITTVGGGLSITGPENRTICQMGWLVIGTGLSGTKELRSESEANARLIAAAPGLLKTAKLALMEFARISHQVKANPEVIAAIQMVIANAEGAH